MPSQLKSVFDALSSLPLSEDSPENGKTNIRISFSTNYQKHEDQCPQIGNSLYLLIFFSILNCVFYKYTLFGKYLHIDQNPKESNTRD